MPIARANSIEICYESFGDPSDPTILLIRGLGGQMIAWREAFCGALAERGFHVVRFDNRDVGLSTKITSDAFPDLDASVPYALKEMAADAVGLLDHLDIQAAHIVGISLGGMIAQSMAIEFPERVLSLVSIASHMGGEDAIAPTAEAAAIFIAPESSTREEAIEKAVADRRIIGSRGELRDDSDARDVAERSYDRCHYPEGRLRQIAAVRSAPSRREALGRLQIPALVIHGDADPLVPVENGRRTAEAIRGGELLVIPDMGHDVPRGAWTVITDAITNVAQRSAARTA